MNIEASLPRLHGLNDPTSVHESGDPQAEQYKADPAASPPGMKP